MKMVIAMLAVVVAGQVASAMELDGANPPSGKVFVQMGACYAKDKQVSESKYECVDLHFNPVQGAEAFEQKNQTTGGVEVCCPAALPRA